MMINIQLQPELEEFVDQQVKAGRFTSTSEAINVAVMFLKDQQQPDGSSPESQERLRSEIAEAAEQLERGEYADFDAEKLIAEERQTGKCQTGK